jgi:Arc/MetJ-type ribon-helix-helix transcriptional regulator
MSNEKSRTSTGYRIPPDIEKKMNQLIESGEFDTRADVITTSLRFYFDNRNRNTKDEIKLFLASKEGCEFIADIVGQIDQNKKE